MSDPFDYDAYGDELDLAPFRFRLGGQERELPHFQTLTPAQGLALDEGGAGVRAALVEIAGAELADLLLNLPGFKIDKLMQDWQGHAQLKPGESGASSRS